MRVESSFAVCLLIASAWLAEDARAEPRVELDLVLQEGVAPEEPQTWAQLLGDLGFAAVRIRALRDDDELGVRTTGSGDNAVHRVTGQLTTRGEVLLPGGRFRRGDGAKIRAWLDKLADAGAEGVTAPPAAFGLTPTELNEVHEQLKAPVLFETRGQPVGEVVAQILEGLAIPPVFDDRAKTALAGQDVAADELRGVSSGTALAALLRPLGLVLAPYRGGGQPLRLGIADVRKLPEAWPVGWPSTESNKDTLPKLYEFLTVEIKDIPLTEALAAIEQRLEAPLLLDHNSLARHGVELGELRATLPEGRTYYKGALDRLLSQVKPPLKSELRVDETGRPLLWITTVRP